MNGGVCAACGALMLAASGPASCHHCGLSIGEVDAGTKPKRAWSTRKATIDFPATFRGSLERRQVLDLSATAYEVTVAGAVSVAQAEPPVAAILAIDSLAMADDPASLLASWRAMLAPGGLLYVAVPSRPAVGGLRLVFTRKSLMLLMERMGFRLIAKDRTRGVLAGWFRRY